MSERWLLMHWTCDYGFQAIQSKHNEDFIFPWYHTYEDAEEALEEILRNNPQDDIEEPYSDYFFIFRTDEAHEIDGYYRNQTYYTEFRKAL